MSLGTGHADTPGFKTFLFQADDFGLNEPVTRGIIQAFEQGPLTSTSAMTNSPFFSQAMTFWKNLEERRIAGQLPSQDARRMLGEREVPPFDFGIHLNLTQGKPLTGERFPAQLLTSAGFFPGIGTLFTRLIGRKKKYRAALWEELSAQIVMVRDHGVKITHLNAHQYVELLPAVRQMIPEFMQKFGIPVCRSPIEPAIWETTYSQGEIANGILASIKVSYARRYTRMLDRQGIPHPNCYFGISHAGRVNEVLETFLERAHTEGMTEICFHPATEPGHHTLIPVPGWEDPLEKLRPRELKHFISGDCFTLLRKHRVRLGRFSSLSAPK